MYTSGTNVPSSFDVSSLFGKLTSNPDKLREIRDSLQETYNSIDTQLIHKIVTIQFPAITDKHFNVLVAMMTFLYKVKNLREWNDLFIICVDFINSTIGARKAISFASNIFKYVRMIVFEFFDRIIPRFTEANVRSEFSKFVSNSKSVLSSELGIALRDMFVNLIMLNTWFWSSTELEANRNVKQTSKHLRKYFGNNLKTDASYVDIIENVLQTTQSISNTISMYFFEGYTFEDIFQFDMSISQWIDKSHDLEVDSTNTYIGVAVEGKINEVTFYRNIVDHINFAENVILKRLSEKDNRYVEFKRRLGVMKSIRNFKMTSHNGRNRKMPFAAMVHGLPGVGKSVLLTHVCELWDAYQGRKFSKEHIYSRQATEDYWSGYQPKSMPIIHYSEPGSKHKNIVKNQGDKSMDEMLSVIDSLPFMCNMADLESKGNVYACPEMVVIDCNDEELNLSTLKNNPAAIRRRFIYVEVSIKKQYRKDGSCEIDHEKVRFNPPDNPRDIYLLTVYERPTETLVNSGLKKFGSELDIFEFSKLMFELFDRHTTKQNAANDALEVDINDFIPKTSTESAYVVAAGFSCYLLSDSIFAFILYIWSFIANPWKIWSWICFFFEKKGSIINYALFTLYIWLIQIIMMFTSSYKPALLSAKYLAEFHRHNSKATILGFPTLSQKATTWYGLITIIGAIYGIFKISKEVRNYYTQGNIVMGSGKFQTDEETDEFIARVEKDLECQRPRKVKKNMNSIDWDQARVPISIVGQTDTSRTSNSSDKIIKRVMKNMRYVNIKGQMEADTRALGICGNFMLLNKHSLTYPNENGTWEFISKSSLNKTAMRYFTITEKDIVDVSPDLVLINARNELFQDLIPYIPNQLSKSSLSFKAYIGDTFVRAQWYGKITTIDRAMDKTLVQLNTYRYVYPEHHVGFCGTPFFIVNGNTTYLQGIHCANQNDTANCFADGFDSNMIKTAMKKLESQIAVIPIHSQGSLRLPARNKVLSENIHPKHPMCYENVAASHVYGELENFAKIRLKESNLRETKMIADVEKLTGVSPFREDGEPKFVGPPMRPFYVEQDDGTYLYQAPSNEFLKKVSVHKKSLDTQLMSVTKFAVLARLIQKITEGGVTKLTPLKVETAMNGDPDNFYMRSMKGSTSGGFSWPGAKNKYLHKVDLDYNDNCLMPLFDIKEQVCETLESYYRGELAHPLLGCQLKDEPRKNGKMTRMFSMSPVDNTIVHRMFLMPFYSLMPEMGEAFCTSIGINMHSYDVDNFAKGMTSFGDKFMEGDYGGYDTSMPPDITALSNTVVHDVLKHFGYNEKQLKIVRGILSDNLHPTLVLDGVVFNVAGFQPSGKYATAEDNSLKGIILLMYAWCSMMTKEGKNHPLNKTTKYAPDDFWDYVYPKCYGDDMLASIKDEILEHFNNQTYQVFCETIYGMKFTASDKSMNISKYLTWDQTSFLKRNFRYREDLGHWTAPIELNSIMKSISYYLPSKNEDVEVQVLQMTQAALRELFFHLDKEEFSKRRIMMAESYCRHYGQEIDTIFKLYPTWDDIRMNIYPNDSE